MCAHLNKANELYRKGYFTQAKQHYEQARRLQPENSKVLEMLGTLALWENDIEQAMAYFQEAHKTASWWKRLWPFSTQLSSRMAVACYREDDYVNAASWYAKTAGFWSMGPFRTAKVLQKQMAAFRGEQPYVVHGPEETHIPFLMLDPLPVVEVYVAGKGPYHFFIDTGGAEVILQTHIADELGVETYGEITGDFAGGKKAPITLGKLETLKIGDSLIKNIPVHVHPLTGVDEIFQCSIHGVIGTSLLRHFYASIDYANHELLLRQQNERSTGLMHTLARQNIAIPFWLIEMHMMMARGNVNDLDSSLFFVDTGLANRGFLASQSLLDSAGLTLDWTKAEQSPGGGGNVRSVNFSIDKITLGEGLNRFSKENVTASQHQGELAVFKGVLGFDVDGLISHAFFKETCLTMDFKKMRLILQSEDQ